MLKRPAATAAQAAARATFAFKAAGIKHWQGSMSGIGVSKLGLAVFFWRCWPCSGAFAFPELGPSQDMRCFAGRLQRMMTGGERQRTANGGSMSAECAVVRGVFVNYYVSFGFF